MFVLYGHGMEALEKQEYDEVGTFRAMNDTRGGHGQRVDRRAVDSRAKAGTEASATVQRLGTSSVFVREAIWICGADTCP